MEFGMGHFAADRELVAVAEREIVEWVCRIDFDAADFVVGIDIAAFVD
jgi:hypothetical protein